jgi:hypothetical protein
MVRPWRPRTRSIWREGTSKPLPKMIVSTGCSAPSAVTIERARISAIPSVTSSTLERL